MMFFVHIIEVTFLHVDGRNEYADSIEAKKKYWSWKESNCVANFEINRNSMGAR